jgi:hypothetical protein
VGFIHWVGGIFHHVENKVSDVAGRAWNVITTLYHVLTNLGHNVAGAWNAFHRAVDDLGGDVESLGHATWGKLRDVYHRLVPAAIRHAISAAVHFARRELGKLHHLLDETIHHLRLDLTRLAHDVGHWARAAVADLRRTLSSVDGKIARFAHLAGTILASPANFAKWVFGALVSEALPYVEANGEALARSLFHRAGPVFLANVDKIETILTDII